MTVQHNPFGFPSIEEWKIAWMYACSFFEGFQPDKVVAAATVVWCIYLCGRAAREKLRNEPNLFLIVALFALQWAIILPYYSSDVTTELLPAFSGFTAMIIGALLRREATSRNSNAFLARSHIHLFPEKATDCLNRIVAGTKSIDIIVWNSLTQLDKCRLNKLHHKYVKNSPNPSGSAICHPTTTSLLESILNESIRRADFSNLAPQRVCDERLNCTQRGAGCSTAGSTTSKSTKACSTGGGGPDGLEQTAAQQPCSGQSRRPNETTKIFSVQRRLFGWSANVAIRIEEPSRARPAQDRAKERAQYRWRPLAEDKVANNITTLAEKYVNLLKVEKPTGRITRKEASSLEILRFVIAPECLLIALFSFFQIQEEPWRPIIECVTATVLSVYGMWSVYDGLIHLDKTEDGNSVGPIWLKWLLVTVFVYSLIEGFYTLMFAVMVAVHHHDMAIENILMPDVTRLQTFWQDGHRHVSFWATPSVAPMTALFKYVYAILKSVYTTLFLGVILAKVLPPNRLTFPNIFFARFEYPDEE